MSITIKPMQSPAEFEGKGYVHWRSCHETYRGLMGQSYLDALTPEKCTEMAYRWPDNILVAKDGEKVAGFAGYGPCRDDGFSEAGEVIALYVLSEYHGKRVGRALLDAALEQLSKYRRIILWVLKGNGRAIRFYEKCGFRFDGTEQTAMFGKECIKQRMILTQ